MIRAFCEGCFATTPNGGEGKLDANGAMRVFAPEGEACSLCAKPATRSAYVPVLGSMAHLMPSRTPDGRPAPSGEFHITAIDSVGLTLRLANLDGDPSVDAYEVPWSAVRDPS